MSEDAPCLKAELKALKELLLIKIDSQQEVTNARLEGLDIANSLAKKEMDRRLEGMNEVRAQLKDQAGTFITRSEHDSVLRDITEIKEFRMRFITREEHDVLTKEIAGLRESRALLEGKASQASVGWAQALAIGGLVAAAISIILEIVHLVGKV